MPTVRSHSLRKSFVYMVLLLPIAIATGGESVQALPAARPATNRAALR